jgi:branched-chain amino acid transport system permease protein
MDFIRVKRITMEAQLNKTMRLFRLNTCGKFTTSYEEELTFFKTGFSRLWLIIGLVLIFGYLPFALDSHTIKILSLIGIYSIAAIGVNILTGYTGMISLGHAAIFGVGAYSASILAIRMQAPFWIAVPAGAVISAIVGTGFGMPALRLAGYYLCFATLAGQKIMDFIFIHYVSLTGGPAGMSITGTDSFLIDMKSDRISYYVIFISLVITVWTVVNLMRSKFGRGFAAIRDNQEVAGILGIPVSKYKLLSFALSSFYAGLAGALFACYNLNISPGFFDMSFSIILMAMVIVGGLGSIPGAIFGAIAIVSLKEILAFGDTFLAAPLKLSGLSITVSSLYEFAVGILIVLFIIFKPKGLADVWRDIRALFSAWPFLKCSYYGFKRSFPPDK